MNEIISAFSEHGLNPGQLTLDGKVHRFSADSSDQKKSGWYVGFQNHTLKSGQLFQVVVYGNFRTSETHTFQTGSVTYTGEDRKQIAKQIALAKKAEEAIRQKAQEEVAEAVAKSWSTFVEGTSEYFRVKQIADWPDSFGARFDETDCIVPARDADGKIWSYQRIKWDGTKWFHPGGRIRGCFHCMGDIDRSSVIYLCEGFATGASIRIATNEFVAVAFTASNLVEVGASLKKLYPDKPIIVCGDDDRWKDDSKNAGREKAEESAKKCLGQAAFPKFESDDGKPTDWNDLHVREGIGAVQSQLKAITPSDKMALYALGFKEGEYFFTSTSNRQVVSVSSFTEDNLLKLMPLAYWEAVYPGRTETSRCDWSFAKSELISKCQKRGIFDGYKVRGAGVWMDDGRVVVHMGDHLIIDGARLDLGQVKSRYFYTLGKTLEPLSHSPLSVMECRALIKVCGKFMWTKPDSGVLLAGALVNARVCGSLPVRPHIWITGGALTGKTTLLEKLIKPILGDNTLYVQGSTTEAGVRQSLKADAVPVLFDEFETNGPKSAENVAACIELMRAAWSDSSAMIVKGGATGNATHFQVKCCAIVSSIRTRLNNDADRGRFATLELAPHGSGALHWSELSELLAGVNSEYSERLFARTIKMMPILLSNFKLLKVALAKRADSRFGDQYGMLLAGYSVLLSDDPIDASDAEFLADTINLEDEKERAKEKDENDALTHLLTTKIRVGMGAGAKDLLVQQVISKLWNGLSSPMITEEKNALLGLGIRVETEFIAIVVGNHAELEAKVWRGTKWSQNWGGSLQRITGSSRDKMRIAGPSVWALKIPIKAFELERNNA